MVVTSKFRLSFQFSMQTGDYQTSWSVIKKSLEIFPEHADSKILHDKLKHLLTCL